MKISILGCGIFGSAIKTHLLKKKHTVYSEEIKDSEIIFVSVPSYAVVSVLLKFKNEIKDQKIIICSKGFSSKGELFSEVLAVEFSGNEILFLYGPTLADEFEQGVFSAMVLAGKGESKNEIKKQIESDSLLIELSEDVVGVQVASALKNVVTIFVGFMEGAGYGQNTRAFVFTRGVQEIQKIGVAMGAERDTFLGLTCVGDLTLKSRNRNVGIEFSQGKRINEFIPKEGSPQEGIETLKIIKIITKKINVETPFMDTLYSIVFENLSINAGLERVR